MADEAKSLLETFYFNKKNIWRMIVITPLTVRPTGPARDDMGALGRASALAGIGSLGGMSGVVLAPAGSTAGVTTPRRPAPPQPASAGQSTPREPREPIGAAQTRLIIFDVNRSRASLVVSRCSSDLTARRPGRPCRPPPGGTAGRGGVPPVPPGALTMTRRRGRLGVAWRRVGSSESLSPWFGQRFEGASAGVGAARTSATSAPLVLQREDPATPDGSHLPHTG